MSVLSLGGGGQSNPASSPSAAAGPGTNPAYQIGGALPFQQMQGAGNVDFSGNPANLTQDYSNAYNAALNLNATNYSNILGGFQQTQQNMLGQQSQINQGYTQLGQNVQGLLQGADQSQMQNVNNLYAQNAAGITGNLTNNGLGNSTITGSMLTGNAQSQGQAQTGVANSFAQLEAGDMSQIGQAGLQQQNSNMMQNTAEVNQQLNFQNSVSAPYPNGQLYGQLAQQYGATQQANANRALQSQLAQQMLGARGQVGAGGGGGGTLGTGYMPAQTPGMFSGGGAAGPYPSMPGNGGATVPSTGGAGGASNLPGSATALNAGALAGQTNPGGGGQIANNPSTGQPYTASDLSNWSQGNASKNGGNFLFPNGTPGYVNPSTGEVTNAQGQVVSGADMGAYGWAGGPSSPPSMTGTQATGPSQSASNQDPTGQYTQSNAGQNGGYYLDGSGQWQYDPMSDPSYNSGAGASNSFSGPDPNTSTLATTSGDTTPSAYNYGYSYGAG